MFNCNRLSHEEKNRIINTLTNYSAGSFNRLENWSQQISRFEQTKKTALYSLGGTILSEVTAAYVPAEDRPFIQFFSSIGGAFLVGSFTLYNSARESELRATSDLRENNGEITENIIAQFKRASSGDREQIFSTAKARRNRQNDHIQRAREPRDLEQGVSPLSAIPTSAADSDREDARPLLPTMAGPAGLEESKSERKPKLKSYLSLLPTMGSPAELEESNFALPQGARLYLGGRYYHNIPENGSPFSVNDGGSPFKVSPDCNFTEDSFVKSVHGPVTNAQQQTAIVPNEQKEKKSSQPPMQRNTQSQEAKVVQTVEVQAEEFSANDFVAAFTEEDNRFFEGFTRLLRKQSLQELEGNGESLVMSAKSRYEEVEQRLKEQNAPNVPGTAIPLSTAGFREIQLKAVEDMLRKILEQAKLEKHRALNSPD